jgi:hypothetical protein
MGSAGVAAPTGTVRFQALSTETALAALQSGRSGLSAAEASRRLSQVLLWGLAVEIGLILLIDYTPWGNRLFNTAPIPIAVWLFVVPFAAGIIALEEGRKALVRRRRAT